MKFGDLWNIPLEDLRVKQQLINLLITEVTCWVTFDQQYSPGSNNIDELLLNVAIIEKQHVTQQLTNFWSEKQHCCSTIDQYRPRNSIC